MAGKREGDSFRVLEVLKAGNFLCEIAALAGMFRTSHEVAKEATTLLQVPADTL